MHIKDYKRRDKKRYKAIHGMKMDRSIFVIKDLHEVKRSKRRAKR